MVFCYKRMKGIEKEEEEVEINYYVNILPNEHISSYMLLIP